MKFRLHHSLAASPSASALASAARPCVEALESRQYRDSSPWAWNATMIHQDDAVADFPYLTGAGETVVVLDTGVDTTHPDIPNGKVIYFQDFISTKNTTPTDTVGHGTGISGQIAGAHFDYNGYQDQGIATGVNLIVLRTDTEKNTTPWATQAQRIANALDWVIANAAKYNVVGINMSTGGNTGFTDPSTPNDPDNTIDQTLRAKFATLAGMGIFMAAAAGNDGATMANTVEYPAADPNVYAISSVNINGQLSAYASRGALTDLVAPGENIYMPYGAIPGSYYVPYGNAVGTGTSFSCPQVVAVAALLKQINPSFTPAQMMQIMQDSGTAVTDPTTGNTFKLLNVDAAIKLAYSTVDDAANHSFRTALGLPWSGDAAELDNLSLPVGQQDYYTFTLTDSAHVTFSLSSTGSYTPAYTLFDASGNSLGSLSGGKTLTLGAGLYYVRVDAGATSLDGTYSLALSRVADDGLNNHTLATATPLTFNAGSAGLSGLVLLGGVNDYYKFTLASTTSVNLLLSSGGSTYPTVTLLNSSGAAITSIPNGGLTRSLAAGTYYLSVASAADLDGTYDLLLTAATSATPPATPGAGATNARIAYDAAGNLYMAWYDATSRTLKFAERPAGSTTWSATTTVDASPAVGSQLSLAIDPSGLPGIAYYDATNANLKYAHFNGSTWDVSTPDYYKTTGVTPSLTYTSAGAPLIAYYQQSYGQLRLATAANASGTGAWSVFTVDASANVGRNPSIAYDPAVNAYGIAYEDVTHGWFRYATYSRGFRASVIDATTTAGGGGISLKFTPTHGLALSYFDAANADLCYAYFNGKKWVTTRVATARSQGQYTNLTFDAAGHPDILYYTATYNAINEANQGANGLWSLTRIADAAGVNLFEASDANGDRTISWIDASGAELLDL